MPPYPSTIGTLFLRGKPGVLEMIPSHEVQADGVDRGGAEGDEDADADAGAWVFFEDGHLRVVYGLMVGLVWF